VPDVPPSAPAAKNYQAAVKLDIDALSARTKRQERIATSNGAAKPPAPVGYQENHDAVGPPDFFRQAIVNAPSDAWTEDQKGALSCHTHSPVAARGCGNDQPPSLTC
jgi:hypothetical protein